MRDAAKNRAEGVFFESLFEKEARRSGLLAIKNHLTCRFIYAGRLQVIPGDLDYKLINQQGRVGFFDCKTFDSHFFIHSQLEEHQVTRAVTYNNWRVPAGFVVWFRPVNRVVFFKGHIIARNGPGSRFLADDGLPLGKYENFALAPLFSKKSA